MGVFSSAMRVLFGRKRNRSGFAACGVVKLLLCLLLPLGTSVGVWGQDLKPELKPTISGKEDTVYCRGGESSAIIGVNITSEFGYRITKTTWTANGVPVDASYWNSIDRVLTIDPIETTTYRVVFEYYYLGVLQIPVEREVKIVVVKKPEIKLDTYKESLNSFCKEPLHAELSVNDTLYNASSWTVTKGQTSVYDFKNGEFTYAKAVEYFKEEDFAFTVKSVKKETCASTFNAKVKVYKPKDIEVNLGGTFCADAKPISGSFGKSPTDADGTYEITLLNQGVNRLNGVNRAVAEAYEVKDTGQYSLTVNYSYLMDGTPKECPSEPVAGEFRVVSVPGTPEWEQAGPLSLCGDIDVKVDSVVSPAGGVDYEYTLNPDGTAKTWRKGKKAVSFKLTTSGTYTVGLSLKGVAQCPPRVSSTPLVVNKQEELVGLERTSFADKLCGDASQSLVSGERKIGYNALTLPGVGVPSGYVSRWVREGGASGPENAASGVALALTFKNDGTGSGQQNGLSPEVGENQYVLQYKLAAAKDECWRDVGTPFVVNVTAKLSKNKIKSSSNGVCNGVEVKIENEALNGGDGNFTTLWIKNGAVSTDGGVEWSGYKGEVIPGLYLREVTSGGCRMRSNQLTIAQLVNPTFTLNSVNPRCKGVSDGYIQVEATSPSGADVAFSYDGGANYEKTYTSMGAQLTKSGFKDGDQFTVVAKTKEGCVSTQQEAVSFSVNDFSIKALSQPASCWGRPVDAELSWTGGAFRTGDAYYVGVRPESGGGDPPVSVGAVTTYTKAGLTKGKYVATVNFPTQTGGCSAETVFEVAEPAPVEPKAFGVLCPGGQDGMIQAKVENATGARYVLVKDSASVWPVVDGNYDGLFIGLPEGRYKVHVSLPGGTCNTLSDVVEVKGVSLVLGLKPSSVNVKCPGDVIEYIEAQSTPATAFTNYIWGREVKGEFSYITTKGPKLLDAVAGKYTLTAVREDGCVVESDALEVKGPFPFAWIKDPLTTPAECKDYKGNAESRGTATLYGVEGGANAQAWWLTTSNPEDVGQPLVYDHQYALRRGTWKVRVKDDNGCAGELDVTVGYNPANSVSFTLQRDKLGGSLCFGERVSGARIVEDPSSVSTIDNTVPPIITLEWREGGVLLADTLVREEDGTYTSRRGVERSSTLRAVVQSTAGCRSEETSNVLVSPPIKLQYDPLTSDIDIFYHQEVVDAKRSWKDASGRMVYRVMKDSIVAGVLSGVPRKVGIEVDYLQGMHGDLSYTAEPSDVLTLDTERKNVFDIALSPEAMDRYRAEGRVVAAQFGRKPIDVLRTTIRVADPKTTCAADFDLYVRLIRELSIPNVFTPNGDGVNDRWLCNSDPTYQTIFSKLTSLLPNMEVEVFNRAGARVWRAKGEQVAEGWDGSAGGVYGGSPLPVGTYYYVIRFNTEGGNSWKPISGSVTIVR